MISPAWTKDLARAWNAGTHGVFILHGNIFDLFPIAEPDGLPLFVNLKSLLAQRIFPNRRMLLFFDVADGLTFATKDMQAEFMKWMESYAEAAGIPCKAPAKFVEALKAVRAYTSQHRDEKGAGAGTTLVVDFAEKIIPAPSSSLSEGERMAEVSLLKFAACQAQEDAGIFLITETPANLSESLANNPYVAQVRLEMPDEAERAQFLDSGTIAATLGGQDASAWCGMSPQDVAKRTAGLNLRRLQNLVAWAFQSKIPFDLAYIAQGKKRLIEEFCQGLVTFKEVDPKKNLDSVANHAAAKAKLRQIARLVREGKLHVIEKGILLPGRIGVGKSYLVSCFASECGMPMLELGNFRSQWVGETEKQLAKILMIIRALGPVIVVIDEADAVLGNSREGGASDSGIGNRIFAALAAHIGDDKMRGREIWIAMTSRPDLLAIDMKRQGRFGLCIPLFPSQSPDETKSLFQTVAKTRAIPLDDEALAAACRAFEGHPITGSDAEAMLVRAQEAAELQGKSVPSKQDVEEAIGSFIDPLDPALLRLQELAAVLACSDKRFLPASYVGADRSSLRTEMQRLLDRP
ncbi:MAG: AAA family ATPase [Verrucomicrobiae bacterium]